MKILQLCHKPPLPATDGGSLAMDAVSQGLLDAGQELRVLTMITHKHPDQPGKIPAAYRERTQYETVFVDTRVKVLPALLNLFGSSSYNIDRFISKDFRARLIRVLQATSFDVVHLESLFLLPYVETIRRHSKARIVYRAHNIEHLVWERLAQNSRGLRGSYLHMLAKRLKRYECENLNSVDGIAAITPEDVLLLRKLGCTKPILHLPYALPLPDAAPGELPADFFHLGAMDWLPNSEGVTFLIEKIWPLIHRERPEAQLFLAGRHMPTTWKSGNGIIIEGEVPDGIDWMRQHGISLVALFSGGGMRIKVAEGMALGKALVATSVAMEGIPATNGEHVLIADTAESFAMAAISLYDNAALRKKLGEAARTFVHEQFDRQRATEKLLEFYRQIVR